MPRDSSGVFTLVDGYEAVTGETIQPSQHNPPLEDIATALTGSLPRNGSAPMLGILKLLDGSASAPSLTFNAETGTGFFRVSAGIIGVAIGGLLVAQFTAGGLAGISPLGTPIPVLDDVLPPLCVWADGRNISRSAYAALFAKWGTKYGAGDSSTTFGMPDMRGTGFIGRDNVGGTDSSRLTGVPAVSGDRLTTGSILGENLYSLLLGHMPAHNHPGGTTDLQGLHTHSTPTYARDGASGVGTFARGSETTGVTGSAGIHGHNVSLPTQGSGTAHNTVQRSMVGNWAIYAGA